MLNDNLDNESNSIKKLDVDLHLKWKEGLSQLDYGLDIKNSTILVFGEISDGTLYDLILRIKAIQHIRPEEQKNDPITLIINSDGGDVYEALGMIDYIQNLDIKVNAICHGRVMSAAALLFCACTGIRSASINSTIMFHQISSGVWGKSSEIDASATHIKKLGEILIRIMSMNTNKDARFWKTKISKDYYLTPEDGLKFGVLDQIIVPSAEHTRKFI